MSSSLVGGVEVHHGFLTSYNSVASIVISTVKAQLALHPSYSLVSLGHSLGAALASLGGISLAQNFPGTPLRVYTFGQPRTGNPAYADLAESLIGVDNIFRSKLCMLFLTFENRALMLIFQQRRHMVCAIIYDAVIQHFNIYLLDGVPTIPPTWLGYRHQYVPFYFRAIIY